jgi:hypothetical protein
VLVGVDVTVGVAAVVADTTIAGELVFVTILFRDGTSASAGISTGASASASASASGSASGGIRSGSHRSKWYID